MPEWVRSAQTRWPTPWLSRGLPVAPPFRGAGTPGLAFTYPLCMETVLRLMVRAGTSPALHPQIHGGTLMHNSTTSAATASTEGPIGSEGPLLSLYAEDETIADILPVFLQNLPRYLGDLATRIESRDWTGAARICHDLKGTAGGYGYPQISEATRKLESLLRAGVTDPGEPALELAHITRLCGRARAAVKDIPQAPQPS
jgi:HPt (histidine-containing phosphotransfer) domain-containing protein